VLADAPCSGSGLFRKDEAAMDEWSSAAVELCAGRQKRILQHAMSLVKEGGYLLYSTCSYSMLENEANADFILASGLFESVSVEVEAEWGIVVTESEKHHATCFRFYPHRLSGEGFFCTMFRKTEGSLFVENRQQIKPLPVARIAQKWLREDIPQMYFHMKENTVFMLEESAFSSYDDWSGFLKIRKSGLKMGALIRDELIPDHELAMSPYLNRELPNIVLNKEDAIRYLRKDDVLVDKTGLGWHLVKYNDQAIGWAKMVNGRLKNHYPLNWRILMQPK
jgi:NOL1/NOP2/fmu family ribosome biogenesis protein